MARRAHGRAVPVTGGVDGLLEAAGEDDTRVIALASPNDPTGELLEGAELSRLLSGLPDDVAAFCSDESLRRVADAQSSGTLAASTEDHPRLLVFPQLLQGLGPRRTGVGYALGAPAQRTCSPSSHPTFGVSEVSQAGALEGAAQLLGDARRARPPDRR